LLAWIILGAYLLTLAAIVLYALHRGWLLYDYHRRDRSACVSRTWYGRLPPVTVQLPIYNERYVVERLIDAVCALDYPRELLEIQVLDDSDDETGRLAARRIEFHAARGLRIEHLRRCERAGYKAGALAHGLARAAGDFVLIFDADFVPEPATLRRLLPSFADPEVGMVQARWGHLNRDASWLTRIQGLVLDGHFHIEHTARHAAGLFFNFNGTAGMWRVACLRDAGGWQADTLTEDLDLSYRAQMRGWRFVYRPDVLVAGELPTSVRAFKGQQARWAQGSIQTARKLLPTLMRSSQPLRVKLEALAHLTSYVPAPLTLLLACLILPSAIYRMEWGGLLPPAIDLILLALAVGPLALFYGAALRLGGRRAWPAILLYLPMVLALGIGISVNNTRALLAGLADRRSAEFVRTPKRGSAASGYRAGFSRWNALAEGVLAAYVGVAIGYALTSGLYPSLPFLLLFLYGFTTVAAASLREPLARGEISAV
jgi:cellulose synthase/poly-beta-1,6-N-acetylglucosamine synthase-like glycosyltransferase